MGTEAVQCCLGRSRSMKQDLHSSVQCNPFSSFYILLHLSPPPFILYSSLYLSPCPFHSFSHSLSIYLSLSDSLTHTHTHTHLSLHSVAPVQIICMFCRAA